MFTSCSFPPGSSEAAEMGRRVVRVQGCGLGMARTDTDMDAALSKTGMGRGRGGARGRPSPATVALRGRAGPGMLCGAPETAPSDSTRVRRWVPWRSG